MKSIRNENVRRAIMLALISTKNLSLSSSHSKQNVEWKEEHEKKEWR